MGNSLLERLRKYGLVPSPDAPTQVAVSQLLQEKADREVPAETASDQSDVTLNVSNGDIKELIATVRSKPQTLRVKDFGQS